MFVSLQREMKLVAILVASLVSLAFGGPLKVLKVHFSMVRI